MRDNPACVNSGRDDPAFIKAVRDGPACVNSGKDNSASVLVARDDLPVWQLQEITLPVSTLGEMILPG